MHAIAEAKKNTVDPGKNMIRGPWAVLGLKGGVQFDLVVFQKKL